MKGKPAAPPAFETSVQHRASFVWRSRSVAIAEGMEISRCTMSQGSSQVERSEYRIRDGAFSRSDTCMDVTSHSPCWPTKSLPSIPAPATDLENQRIIAVFDPEVEGGKP